MNHAVNFEGAQFRRVTCRYASIVEVQSRVLTCWEW